MADAEKSLVLSLAEGIVETVADEIAGGAITQSDNTRLSVLKGSCVRRPEINALTAVTAGAVCGGMAAADDGSTALYFKPGVGQKRVYGTSVADVSSTLIWGTPQNAYFPYPLDLADGLTGLYGYQPAVALDSDGNVWTLGVRAHNVAGSVALFVSVADSEGRTIVASRRITTLTTSGWPTTGMQVTSWCGLTYHGTSGMVAWYHTNGTLRAVKLSLDLTILDVAVGASATITTPAAVNKSITQLYHFAMADVTVDPEVPGFAYLVCVNSAADTAVDILKVDIATLTVSSTLTRSSRLTTGTTNQQHFSATAWSIGSTHYLAVMTSDRNIGGGAEVGTYLDLINASAMSVTWTKSPVTLTTSGYTAALPYYFDGTLYVVAAVSNLNLGSGTAIGTSDSSRTTFTIFTIGGTNGNTIPVYWHKLASRAAYHKISDTEIYPFFPLQVEWNLTGVVVAPGSLSSVLDPSIDVYTFSDVSYAPTPVMRCAVDRAARKDGPQNGNSCVIYNDKLLLSYLEDKTAQAYSDGIGLRARYARFDLAPTQQPPIAMDEGVAVVGASLVAVWDGNETTEYSPLHQPKIRVVDTGGTGPDITGTYSFTAVLSWRDRAGMLRCQACATPVTITLSADKPIVYVTIPSTVRQGTRQDEFEIIVYATGDTSSGGTSLFYAQNMEPTSKSTNGCWAFGSVPVPVVEDIVLDTTGEAGQVLLPECPPPAWDLCVGNSRLWIIDAENRNRLLPSMIKRAWRPYEFSGVLEVLVPTSHGKLVAVENNAGTILAFAEHGIWQIPGYGPDNAGQGGAFGDPQLVSNLGCRSRESVVQVPGMGVLFQAADGVFTLMGGGVERFDLLGDYTVGTPGVFLADCEVAYPLSDGWLVFNWHVKQWTKWPYTSERQITSTTTAHFPERSRVLQYAPSSGAIEYVDSDNVSGSDAMVITRGWIAPAGPQGDCVIRAIWFHARANADHGIRIRVAFDYNASGDDGTYVERTWTAAELDDLTYDGRYTVEVGLHATPARAIKVTVTEIVAVDAADDAMNPLSLTVYYGVNAGQRRRTLKAGASK